MTFAFKMQVLIHLSSKHREFSFHLFGFVNVHTIKKIQTSTHAKTQKVSRIGALSLVRVS